MNQWQVLDLDADPTPGDPQRTRDLSTQLLHEAELAEHNTSRLRRVASNGGDLHMEGDYAHTFRDVLGELPGELAKLGKAYRGCGKALSGFASSLEHAKTQAATALRHGQDAHDRYQGALREIRALAPPDRAAGLSSGLRSPGFLLEAAIADLDESTKTQVRMVARRAHTAEQDKDRAQRLAADAARLRGDAETTCVRKINDALDDSGIKNKSGWRKVWDAISKPFRSWHDFVNLCRNVAMVAGIAAIFISGPIGLALVAAALIAGAAVFADTLNKYAHGKAGLADLAFDALGLIPGGRGMASLAKLGRAASGMARGLRVGGKAVVAGLCDFKSTFASIRSGITDVRRNGIDFAKKMFCRDPIDIATGEMVQQQTDIQLPGVLPLVISRTHLSSYRVGRWFGPSWTSTLDQRLEIDPTGIFYAADDGKLLVYPLPVGQTPVLPEEGPRLPLTRTADGGYTITDTQHGHTLHFTPTGADGTTLPLAAISDRTGNRIEVHYDPDGTLTAISHSGGYRITVETTSGLITALRLADGDNDTDITLVRYRYNTARRLTEVINSSNLPLRLDYDTAGRMTNWTDRNGAWYRYTYDDTGRCVHTTGSGGCLDGSFAYHHNDDTAITKVTNSLGHVTTFHLNKLSQVTRETNPLGHYTASEWDRYDRLLARTDSLGRTTSYRYDDVGNLTIITRPDGTHTCADYNELGLPITMTDPDGAVWQRHYDQHGNLTCVTDPIGATTGYTYGDGGCLTTVTDALGHTRRVEVNAAGLPVTVTDPLGALTSCERDTFGQVIAITDPVGGITRFGWTIEGKPAWRSLPDGATEHWSWDGEGNLVEHIDALGQATRTEIGHFDLPAAQIGPDGARLEFTYDTELRLTAVTNPQGLVWRYDYDPAGNLIQETDFNHRVLTYTHDAAGQLITRTNGAGQTTTFVRDLLGNTTEQHSGDPVTTFAYDPAGRLVHAINPDAELTFQRDPLGRILAETCNGRTLTSTYDPLGRRVSRRTPTGAESTWEYNPNHQPITLHTAGQTLRFSYDPASRETERYLGENALLAQTWDTNHRLASQTLTSGASGGEQVTSARQTRLVQRRSYTYRPDGYLTAINDHLAGARRLDLDPTGRVTAVHGPAWSEHYTYDPAGNITHATWPTPQTDSPDADAQGERQYTGTLIQRAGNVRYQHDAQGRITLRQQKRLSAKPRTWHYTWNSDDRLVAVTTPDGQHWQYSYDPLGRRITKQRLDADRETAAEQTTFTWDGAILAEQTHTSGPNDPGRTTGWEWEPDTFRPITQTERAPLGGGASEPCDTAPDLPEMRDAPQQWIDERFYTIVTDLIGTPTELIDPDGDIAWRPRTTLWGITLTQTSGEADCPLRFPGQYHDAETGLSYNYHRYYEPTNGRYESNDPLGLAPAPNPQTFVSNPTYWADPCGLAPCGTINLYHAATSPAGAQGVANGINHRMLDPNSRFGRALYTAEVPDTALAEIAHHGASSTHGIRFSFEMSKAHTLDLTDPGVASAWSYSGGAISSGTQAVGQKAVDAGYNAIRFNSERGAGANWAILKDFDKLLTPRMITPIG
ncbi:MAG: DUF6531 domain-containing protein [Pseudonocardiaceae bacterium]